MRENSITIPASHHDSRNNGQSRLPRLLYAADVPVEASSSGALLLYRLLESYPNEKLCIAEGLWGSNPDRRLPNVPYRKFAVAWVRLLTSRLCSFYSPIVLASARHRWRRLSHYAAEHRAEAVLTVGHQYSYLTAAALCRRAGLPLYVILHDDPWFHLFSHSAFKPLFDHEFRKCMETATHCFCVSPNMRDAVANRHGVRASVLYPCWGQRQRPARLRREGGMPFAIAYAGNLFTAGYCELVQQLARACISLGYRLILLTNLTEEAKTRLGLAHQQVEIRPMVPPERLPQVLRESADAVFVPMSFSRSDQTLVSLGFPSKLSDSTSFGLPMLIWGPEYCSAIRWARENPGTAEAICEKDAASLEEALKRLARDKAYRRRLASAACRFGREHFHHRRVVEVFHREIQTDSPH